MGKKNKNKSDTSQANLLSVGLAQMNIADNVQPELQRSKTPKIVREWDNYFKKGTLEDWQRLMKDLGYVEEFRSKTECRKTLRKVWVNIYDFLEAVKTGSPVHHFESERQLSQYTLQFKKIYPRARVVKGSPLRDLLAQIFQHGNHG